MHGGDINIRDQNQNNPVIGINAIGQSIHEIMIDKREQYIPAINNDIREEQIIRTVDYLLTSINSFQQKNNDGQISI